MNLGTNKKNEFIGKIYICNKYMSLNKYAIKIIEYNS